MKSFLRRHVRLLRAYQEQEHLNFGVIVMSSETMMVKHTDCHKDGFYPEFSGFVEKLCCLVSVFIDVQLKEECLLWVSCLNDA